jgi:Ni/Co efflux regulator RcnB
MNEDNGIQIGSPRPTAKTTATGRSGVRRIAVATLALCMAAGSVMAQGRHGDDHDRGGPRGNAYGHDRRGDDRRDGPRGDPRFDRQDFRDGRHFDRHGYEPRPTEWRRGGHLPPEYRNRNYVVNDYRAYRLQAPPRGYQWIGVGGEFALAAIATGLIAQIVIAR